MRRKAKCTVTVSLFLIILLCAGCQPNPDGDVVVNKNEGTMEEAIGKAREEKEYAEGDIPEIYQDEFQTKTDGIQVIAEARVHPVEGALPVVRVKPHVITAEETKEWAGVLFEGKTAYEPQTVMTSQELEEQILWLRQHINDREGMIAECGSEEEAESMIDYYEELLLNYERQYQSAPATYEKQECQWLFRSSDYYRDDVPGLTAEEAKSLRQTMQLQAVTDELHGHSALIEASNRDADDFRLNMLWFHYTDEEQMGDLPRHDLTEQEARALTEEMLQQLQVKDWELWKSVDYSTEEESAYAFVYTPVYEGVVTIPGPEINLKSEDLFAANHYYSKLYIYINNGIIRSVELTSPLEQVSVENEDVAVIGFEEACEAFKTQMQTQYSRANFIDPEDPALQGAEVSLNVTEITQGLFRIKEKENKEEFLMVPAWEFSGQVLVDGQEWSTLSFAYINALDGSVINPELGY